MIFTTIEFIAFLFSVVLLHYAVPHKFRWIVLLFGSLVFYAAWNIYYSFLMLLSIVTAYSGALLLSSSVMHSQGRRLVLGICLALNFGMLALLKYYDFMGNNVAWFLSKFDVLYKHSSLGFLLPVGISFYTFQATGYLIDAYRGETKAEKHLGYFALFITFFPQLVAGPIEKASSLIPQLRTKHIFDESLATSGLRLILWGLFKKMAVADLLASIVDPVFADLHHWGPYGPVLWLPVLFFSMQIYCDFSGYCDIAVGVARLFGINLTINFNYPYFSSSIREFWRRWHITLGSWLKDYVYIPLGGSRVPVMRWRFNLLLTFFVTGLWHGASWTFVAWGLYHAILIIFSAFVPPITGLVAQHIRIVRWVIKHRVVNVGITFLLVSIGWIFFRSPSLYDAAYVIYSGLFRGWRLLLDNPREILTALTVGQSSFDFLLAIVLSLFVFVADYLCGVRHISVANFPRVIRWATYYSGVFIIVLFNSGSAASFIYFQF